MPNTLIVGGLLGPNLITGGLSGSTPPPPASSLVIRGFGTPPRLLTRGLVANVLAPLVGITVFTSTGTGRNLFHSTGTRRGLDPAQSLGKRR